MPSTTSKENRGAELESSDDDHQAPLLETQLPPEEEPLNKQDTTKDDDDDDSATSSHDMMQLETQPRMEESEENRMSAATADDDNHHHHVRFPPMPTRSPLSRRTRLQSISKPTTTIHMDSLPTLTTLMRDQLEYACHTVVAADDGYGTAPGDTTLLTSILPVFWTLLPTTSRKCGRVYSRLQLAALSTDFQHAGTSWTADDWKNAEQQLLFVRGKLLRRNANVWMDQTDEAMAKSRSSSSDDDEFSVDEQLGEHDMMVHACREVLVLVRTQQLLAAFRAALHVPEATVQDVLADFRGRFVQAYRDGVPEELQPLVVGDLYSPKKKQLEQQPRDWDKVKDRVLDHLERVIQEGDYSIENTVRMARSLLLRWDESILDIPTLVQLGYGDVPNPVIRHAHKVADGADDDDVSSMGGEPEDYRSMSITEQDKMDITQLQSVQRPNEEEEEDDDDLHWATQPPVEEEDPADSQRPLESQPEACGPVTSSIDNNGPQDDDPTAAKETDGIAQQKAETKSTTVVMMEEEEDEPSKADDSKTRSASPPSPADVVAGGSDSDATPLPPPKRSAPVVNATGIVRPKFMDSFRALLAEGKRDRDDSDSSAKENSKRRRRSFTNETDEAILEGVRKHGAGKWAEIAARDERLDQWSGVEIRDRFNELERSGAA